MKKIILTILISVSFIIQAQAAIYYVSVSGNDANDGLSAAHPWKSLKKVSSTVFNPGDRILFKSAELWQGTLTLNGSGTKEQPIRLGRYGEGGLPVLNGLGTNESATIELLDQSYWHIGPLEITNRQRAGGHARLTGILVKASKDKRLTGITISHCFVHDVGSVWDEKDPDFSKGCGGIILSGLTDSVLVEYCHIKDVSVEGIRNSSAIKCSHIVIDHNLLENVYGDGIVFHGVKDQSSITYNTLRNTCYNTSPANYAGAWTYLSDSSIIAFNEVSGITGGGKNDGQPFDADIAVNGDIFEYNYSHDNAKGFMLFMPSAKNVIVRFNLSVNDIKTGAGNQRLFNYTVRRPHNNKIYNNTFYIDAEVDYLFQGGFIGEFFNNIVYSTRPVKAFADKKVDPRSVIDHNSFTPESIASDLTVSDLLKNQKNIPACFKGNPERHQIKAACKVFELCNDSPLKTSGKIMAQNGGMDFKKADIQNREKAAIGAIW